jgi:glucose/arabinose dehydrogenase
MRNALVFLALIIVGGLGFLFVQNRSAVNAPTATQSPSSQTTQGSQRPNTDSADSPAVSIVAENLDTPWAIAFLPDKSMLVTERQGTVKNIDTSGKTSQIGLVQGVLEMGEGGLLGVTLHPDFTSNNYVYFYYTYSGSGDHTLNRVVRMTYQQNQLKDQQIIVDQIPGASNHNGGRIKFGPDKFLYIATGDAQEPSLSQNRNSLAGKILRVTDTGQAASGNPFNNLVYTYGHRNPQGLAWDKNNTLFSTEHGPSGGSLGTGNDEVNKIDMGRNYGWPEIQGNQTQSGMERPISHSGTDTWAPAGAAILGDTLYYGGLRGQALYRLNTSDTNPTALFKGEYGRIREVILGPDNLLYITTSNKDGRGNPRDNDDKIVRINPQKL